MNILVVSSLYERPGSFTGQHVHRLSRELTQRGLRVDVLCPLGRFDRNLKHRNLGRLRQRTRQLRLDDVEVSYLPYVNVPHSASPALDTLFLRRRLWLAMSARGRPDLIHAHRLFPTGDAAVWLARRLNVPVVVTAHGSDVHTHPASSSRVARRTAAVIESADRLTAVSQDLAERILAVATPRVPVAAVRLGVDTDRFKPGAGKDDSRSALGLPRVGPGFVSVSRLARAKGVFDLLAAFGNVAAEYPDAWLALVGDGPAAGEIRRRAAESGLKDRVFFAGAQTNEDVPAWLNAADVFVLASHAEGLPNVVLEAMACGLPTVVTRVGGTAEAVLPGTGLLVPPKEERALTAAMRELASSPDLRARMGIAALERATSYFTWSRVADDYISVYEGVLSVPRTASAWGGSG